MSAADAGPGRILRRIDGAWHPVGPLLPPVEDPEQHAPLRPGRLTHWHLHGSVEVQSGDLVIVREHVVRVLDRCGPSHYAVQRLAEHVRARWANADDWLADRQVWSARVLASDAAERLS